MLNRTLSLIVSVVAPASAATMLVAGAHPIGTVSIAARASCAGLAIVAALLAVAYLRARPAPGARAEAGMWSGLAIFFAVAAFASPHLSAWAIAATLALAAASAVRLVGAPTHAVAVAASPIRRRLFA